MADRIYKVARIGTREVAIEEAPDARTACYKAGWAPSWCETMDITDEVTELEEIDAIADKKAGIIKS